MTLRVTSQKIVAKKYKLHLTGLHGMQNTGSQGCPCPNPKNCEYVILHGKRGFNNVIKYIDFEVRLSWIIQMVLI